MFACGIWITAQGIWIPTNELESRILVSLTKAVIQYLESGIQGVESRIQDCLGFSYMGREVSSGSFTSLPVLYN